MQRERQPCVYMLASGANGTLYVGVTSNLTGRVLQHRAGAFDGFTKRYAIHRLVYYEVTDDSRRRSRGRSNSSGIAGIGNAT